MSIEGVISYNTSQYHRHGINKVRASPSHYRHHSKHRVGNLSNKVVSFKINILPSDVLETAKILNIRLTNYDLGIPMKKTGEEDHHSAEYIEVKDEEDIIKIEDDDDEDGPCTSNSQSSSGKRREKLKLRL